MTTGEQSETRKNIDFSIGASLHSRRVELGVTKAELAQCLGIGENRIKGIEAGTSKITAAELYRAAKRLNVSIDAFYAALKAKDGPLPDMPSPPDPKDIDEAENLIRNFMAIKDPATRRNVLEIIKATAKSCI